MIMPWAATFGWWFSRHGKFPNRPLTPNLWTLNLEPWNLLTQKDRPKAVQIAGHPQIISLLHATTGIMEPTLRHRQWPRLYLLPFARSNRTAGSSPSWYYRAKDPSGFFSPSFSFNTARTKFITQEFAQNRLLELTLVTIRVTQFER